ncbi:PatB family C-S lyase [Aromatoleum toluolicum]|uniref:cysteine-S-conjugate beta-lyase n=1 Tax=Aromatoleum toluolicum TaxID=90060 RepID=A0ABX1NBA5_9RHOO|nr:PatB family C-S lyase [Aromatoleum toluolicum]NMF96567.1 PatB family C-S lyase [Aromatoleum toluolicum]
MSSAPFDFDHVPDRRAVPGEKWSRYAGRDVLPLWVADMDFPAPPPVIDAIRARIDHRVFGYTDPWPSISEAVIDGIARDHGWRIEADWIVWLPGVVTGFNLACRATGEAGDEVFTATPVYPPFLTAPGNSDRRLVTRALKLDKGRWGWDRAEVEDAITARTRLLMLCNPHNPVGRVFDRDELTWLAGLAERHDLTICSDEIHCGLVLDPATPHIPIAALDAATARRTITLMAPSKTWNIPALYCALAIIPDPGLRRRFRHEMRGVVPHNNLLGLVAAEAAYRDGGPWRAALLDYLRGNLDLVLDAVASMPGLATTRPEATYLAWIDCRGAGLEDPMRFFEDAGVGLSDGAPFGMPGFVRLNFGCPRALLGEALRRMQGALHARLADQA